MQSAECKLKNAKSNQKENSNHRWTRIIGDGHREGFNNGEIRIIYHGRHWRHGKDGYS